MPMPYANACMLAHLLEPGELIVDQSLERRDVEAADGCGRLLLHEGDDGEKGCLGLPRGGGGTQQQVIAGIEYGIGSRCLHRPKALPPLPVDVVLDEGGITGEEIHDTTLSSYVLPYCYGTTRMRVKDDVAV